MNVSDSNIWADKAHILDGIDVIAVFEDGAKICSRPSGNRSAPLDMIAVHKDVVGVFCKWSGEAFAATSIPAVLSPSYEIMNGDLVLLHLLYLT